MTAFFARGGVMSSLGEEGGHPVKPRSGQGDHQTGLACCTAVLGALLLRQKTGKGSLAEASLIRSATWNLVRAWSTVALRRSVWRGGFRTCISHWALVVGWRHRVRT
jgi:crotonobetainyl-CoA:carnitine CoA-transferase CaiB-like acyl-CoA transferase